MTIVSVSVDDGLLAEIDAFVKAAGIGRSEFVRTSAKAFFEDEKVIEKLRGHVDAILIVSHRRRYENRITKIKHGFENIISTQFHNNLCNDTCLQVFFIHGDAHALKALLAALRMSRTTDYLKLMVP